MDGWSVAILVGGGFVAVTTLVRLMIAHRDRLVADFRRRMRAEAERRGGDSGQPEDGR